MFVKVILHDRQISHRQRQRRNLRNFLQYLKKLHCNEDHEKK